MNPWLQAHRNAARLAILRLWAAPFNLFLAVLGIGIVLALPTGGQWLLGQVSALLGGTTATPQVTIFMPSDAERKQTQAIESRLKDRGDVKRVQVLLREDTLTRMKSSEGLGDVLTALPKNPFPDALVVTPASDSPAALEKIASEARQWREVAHVQIDADWARRLAAFIGLARTGVILLALLLGLGLVSITFNTVRLQVLMREDEVVVSRLLGATEAFIRRPFLWHGALLGLLGGLVAWLIVAAAMLWLRAPVADLAQLYGATLVLVSPGPAFTLSLLALAAGLGWLGAALSMRRQLPT